VSADATQARPVYAIAPAALFGSEASTTAPPRPICHQPWARTKV